MTGLVLLVVETRQTEQGEERQGVQIPEALRLHSF